MMLTESVKILQVDGRKGPAWFEEEEDEEAEEEDFPNPKKAFVENPRDILMGDVLYAVAVVGEGVGAVLETEGIGDIGTCGSTGKVVCDL
jgi:hypothetical protein